MRTILEIIAQTANTFIDYIAPIRCPGCGDTHSGICRYCRNELWNAAQWSTYTTPGGLLVHFAWPYHTHVFQETIRMAKFHARFPLLKELVLLAPNPAPLFTEEKILLCPIPLHPDREIERGYNQALLIANQLAQDIPNAIVWHGLRRTKKTKQQSLLENPEERAKNIENAFSIKTPPPQGARVVLVDDVCTTGATLDGAKSVFLKNVYVQAICLAGPTEC